MEQEQEQKQVHVTNYAGGLSFPGALQIAFIVLKLCGVISWPWPVVLLPVLIPLGLLGVLIAGGLLLLAVVSVCTAVSHRKGR